MQINKKISLSPVSYTPAYFKTAVTNYKQGNFRELLSLFENTELDAQYIGCITGRRAGFARDWRVTAAAEDTEAERIKEFIESQLKRLNIMKLSRHIFEARLKGYSIIELNWAVEDSQHIISGVSKIHQKYFRYDKDGRLKIDFGNKDLREIPEDSALVVESDETPLLLPVTREFILKEFGIESWASFIETFGEAFVLGKYPPGADKKTKDELEAAVNAIASSARGIAPDGTGIEFKEVQRNTGDHENFARHADKSISIVLLGHANAVDDSKSMSIGENLAAYKVKRELAVDDILFIEEQIEQLIKIVVRRNFNTSLYPQFRIDKSEPINIEQRLKVLKTGYDMGLKINPAEFGKLGIQIYEDQEALQKDDINFLD